MFIKKILPIVIILICQISFAQQKKGLIIDPDGYTNIRESADGNSAILSRIFDGEVFTYTENESSWIPVTTYNGVKGFVHKSRIKEFKINRNFCLNPNLNEIFLYYKYGRIISVCGISASYIKDFTCYSGLDVYDSSNKKKLLEFDEGKYQSFEFQNGDIVIKEYADLPVNKDLENKFVPYAVNKVLYAGERLVTIKNAPYYNYPKLSKQEIQAKIEFLKANITNLSSYEVIDIALVLALNDSSQRDLLFNLNEEFDLNLDGEYHENYFDALLIYKLNKNNR